MGWRFRRSVKLFPGVRLNFSKSGISTSLGRPGASINLGPKGARYTAGLPGTGINFSALSSRSASGAEYGNPTAQSSGSGCLGLLAAVVGLFLLVSFCSKPEPSKTSAEESQGHSEFVSASSLRCRSGPSTAESAVRSFTRQDEVRVLDKSGGWAKVGTPNDFCWVSADHLVATAALASAAATQRKRPVGLVSDIKPQKNVKSSKGSSRHKKASSGSYGGGTCPCSGTHVCIGPRGGRYCITSGGNKRYGV